jgi:hypothetical protein
MNISIFKNEQLPAHVYRMRETGYPPGYRQQAKVTPSGLRFIDNNESAFGFATHVI